MRRKKKPKTYIKRCVNFFKFSKATQTSVQIKHDHWPINSRWAPVKTKRPALLPKFRLEKPVLFSSHENLEH